jgi:hypothetical protein
MSEEFRKRLPLMSTLCCDSIAHNSRRAPPLWRFFTDGLRRGIRKDQLVLVLLRSLQPQKSEVLTTAGPDLAAAAAYGRGKHNGQWPSRSESRRGECELRDPEHHSEHVQL